MTPGDRDVPDNLIVLPGRERILERPRDTPPPSTGIEEAIPFQDVPPDSAHLGAAAEAVLFTAGDPVPLERLRSILGGPEEADLRAALVQVATRYERAGHGIRLVEVAGGWQLRTHPRYAVWVGRACGVRPLRLSRAALETLAVVAYRQPVTRAEIEAVRGVDPGGILRAMVDHGLVRVCGHREEPGRPLLYGTTRSFLEVFGLGDLSDLPTLRDLREFRDDDPEAGLDLEDLPEDGDLLEGDDDPPPGDEAREPPP
ncbi:MAG: SMC-Scp complex subunit ScpB [Deltaproteobacteria bacterium]|nr:SMC-Scp complex subunit ScpB [Deltaproteobacteria bacterium]